MSEITLAQDKSATAHPSSGPRTKKEISVSPDSSQITRLLLRSLLFRLIDIRPVRIEFYCGEEAEELKFISNILSGLVNPEALAIRRDSGHGSLFLTAIRLTLK